MIYAQKIADRLVGEDHTYMSINKCVVDKNETKALRTKIHSLISNSPISLDIEEIDMNKGSKKKGVKRSNEMRKKTVKTNKEVVIEEEKLSNNNNHNTDRVCWKWVNFKCWRNNNCKYDHPEMCEADIDRKPCSKNPCNLFHPQLCNANQNRKVCRWGEKCKYRHTQDNIPRYSHRKHYNNTSHHRTPDDNYNRPRENYRNSTDFRREWPTLREEEILRKLMYMIQMETGNWRPMDGRRPQY